MGTKITTPEGYIIESDSSDEAVLVARELTAPSVLNLAADPVPVSPGPLVEVPVQMTLEEIVATLPPPAFPSPSWADLTLNLSKTNRNSLAVLVKHDIARGRSVAELATLLTPVKGETLTHGAAGQRMLTLLGEGLVERISFGYYRATEEVRNAYRK